MLIRNKERVTRVFVNGKELEGVKSVKFSHDAMHERFPVISVELLAEQICLETAQIFALPEVYRPYYVSSDKLVENGILTGDELNELLNKGLL